MMVVVTLDMVQVQIIEFESITFSFRDHELFVGPEPSYNPLRMELFAYMNDMVSISIFLILIPLNLGSTIPSLLDKSKHDGNVETKVTNGAKAMNPQCRTWKKDKILQTVGLT